FADAGFCEGGERRVEAALSFPQQAVGDIVPQSLGMTVAQAELVILGRRRRAGPVIARHGPAPLSTLGALDGRDADVALLDGGGRVGQECRLGGSKDRIVLPAVGASAPGPQLLGA